ncbi:MAG: HEAT repeat domain-containing protein [Myxococcales bacterium]|nr:HEAT repeat domain-containing protein [Myxococcales bacterium]
MRRALFAVALWAALGCKSKPPEGDPSGAPAPAILVVTRLEVVDGTPPDKRPATVPSEHLKASLEAALKAAGYRLGEAEGDAWSVRIDAQVVYGLSDGTGLLDTERAADAQARWGVEVELRPPGQPEASHAWLEGEAKVKHTPGGQALGAVLAAQTAAALAPVQAGLAARRESIQLTEAQLVERLADAVEQVRWAAVDRLAELKAKGAVPALTARAAVEPSRTIKLRIVGALAEIGDERAAEALMGLAEPRDRELLRAVVDALSVVGGDRVDDFLDILATHDAADVRQMVEQARARMARRARRPEDKETP